MTDIADTKYALRCLPVHMLQIISYGLSYYEPEAGTGVAANHALLRELLTAEFVRRGVDDR